VPAGAVVIAGVAHQRSSFMAFKLCLVVAIAIIVVAGVAYMPSLSDGLSIRTIYTQMKLYSLVIYVPYMMSLP
jgi:hypothetical protein